MNNPDPIEYLTDPEIKALLKEINRSRDLAIILLLIGTGLKMKELLELNLDSIDWEKKLVHVGGPRKRDMPLNDEVFEALSAWSKDRQDNPSEALFITVHGRPKRLTKCAAKKLAKKYACCAGIRKDVNFAVLRNTFGVRLMAKETSIDNAAAILGLHSPISIQRYMKGALDEKKGNVPGSELEKLDTRPRFIRNLSKLVHPKHKEARVITPSVPAGRSEVTVDRTEVLSGIKRNLSRELSTLIIGPPGIGKTHLLKVSAGGDILYLASPCSVRQFLTNLCDKYCPAGWPKRLRSGARAPAWEIAELLSDTLKGRDKKAVIAIDNFDSSRISDLEVILTLFDNFTVVAAADETPARLKELWWKFRKIEIPPLDRESSKELIKHLTAGLTIVDYELLETRILTVSNGMPLAIVEMVGQVSHLPVVRKEDARQVYHEAGIRYRDWTPLVLIIWSIATSSRFITLGSQSFEGYILALIGMAALAGGIRFLRSR